MARWLVFALLMLSGVAMAAPPAPPIVIAHRGASAERPEHTLEAYAEAIREGADFIEPDLVPTKDGVLVARHENEISGTTDVAERPEFAGRKATKTIDGELVTGWFTEDFTLAELKTLRAKERLPQLRPANRVWDGKLEVPTLQEIIDLVRAEAKRSGRVVGIYPETKHPSYFRSIGLPLEARLVEQLHRNGYKGRKAPVFIQSFEVDNLKLLRSLTDLPLIQLVGDRGAPADGAVASYDAMMEPAELKAIARYADGIGPFKDRVIPRKADGSLGEPSCLVPMAHAEGLKVHPWTMRPENYFLPLPYRRGDDPTARGDAAGEIAAFLKAGVDGVFSDSPAAAVTAVRQAVPAAR
ncbi:glycerophosphodiester phosphodiesterase [Sandaracinobacteroides saxicola]|uniref:glycerophosphodiester phosphodiesterase n=1 Tax=Sandaracinobacteroides saxicola TaxID=2759707 RepID=A0A7G5ILX7_9SPHN|nr:glycerophosphodiester phosphodiesterase [Sandaracinobacteroides saxicola]QMW24369.1 glycerophosphodiester phosphodiesterase [Sandaracinobacteroides saxicola]